jgi:CBS domain-containing membrane protein
MTSPLLPHWLRSFGPTLPHPAPLAALRSAIGAGFGLLATALILWALTPADSLLAQPLLIAPFGASAYLAFVVPASPLAQPWAVVMGNTVAATAALLVLQLGMPPLLAAPLAVAAAVLALGLARAQHPPGGAVALLVAITAPGWAFVLTPVLVGSAALVTAAVIWNSATGHAYPHALPHVIPPAKG